MIQRKCLYKNFFTRFMFLLSSNILYYIFSGNQNENTSLYRFCDSRNLPICEPSTSWNSETARNVNFNNNVCFFETDGNEDKTSHVIDYDNERNVSSNENYDDDIQDQNDNELNVIDDVTTETFEYNCDNINEDENIQDEETVMFQSSQTTLSEVILMIHTYCVRFNVSDAGRHALFDMVKAWANPELKNVNFTKYIISKTLDPPEHIYFLLYEMQLSIRKIRTNRFFVKYSTYL